MARANRAAVPEHEHQANLRAQRKRPKAAPRKAAPVQGKPRTLLMVIQDRSPENLQEAYRRLKGEAVTTYFRRYLYHDNRQKAVMRGEVILQDLPPALYRKLASVLSAGGQGWKMGSVNKGER